MFEPAHHLTVGELARRTGLTVRTLHHYDQIGLVRPTARTPAGYRLYGPDEFRRLQHVASLRVLGLSLDAIQRCLSQGAPSLPEVLDDHLVRLRAEVVQATQRRDRLERIRAHLDDDTLGVEEWLTTIHETLRFERHYSPEQLDRLRVRKDETGPDELERVERAWVEIFAQLEQALNDDLPADAPAVQAVARRARALVDQFTGSDPELERALGAMYDAEGTQPLVDRGLSVRPEVWALLGAAMEGLELEK